MKIIADTNVLLRAVLPDEGQREEARKALSSAQQVAISLHVLCESVWVMSHSYRAPRREIGALIRRLLNTGNVVIDHSAVAAGLALLDLGGDFADGVIAHEGRRLGCDTFVSFDRKAVKLVQEAGCRRLAARPACRPDSFHPRAETAPTERSRFVGASLAR